jgi:DTW domain-containing protein YfiP
MPRQSCSECLRPISACYCPHLSRQCNQWPVYIIQDVRESRHALGTARIAALSLSNCNLLIVDPNHLSADEVIDLQALRDLQPALIYPGDNAADVSVLTELPIKPLIFIDASWRRSRKIIHLMPWLAALPRYQLRLAGPSRYRIRKQPHIEAISTLEAVVAVLSTLEPDHKFDSLLDTMDRVIDQQIQHMGDAIYQSNYQQQT